MNLKEYIKKTANEIGIDIIGFTNSEDMGELEDFLEWRKLNRYEIEFEEKDIKKRISPKKLMKDTKTIIVIGVSYNMGSVGSTEEEAKLKGKVTKSALGIDYHIVLKDKMDKLITSIKQKIGDFNYFIGVDTTPLIDRYLAKKAGVGWFGKNCSIINKKYGSFFSIGYILTNLELEHDNELEGDCGDCKLCIKACPTGAIEEDYKINAKICVSYLTQTKENIPYNLREKMGVKLYGCDTCQLVCPKNEEIVKKKIESLDDIEKYNPHIDIENVINISNKDFKNKYGDRAFSWRGKNIIKRNAIIALGNLKEKENISILKNTLKDDSNMIRKYSAWSILNIDLEEGEKIVGKHIKHEKDEELKEEMKNIIHYFKNEGGKE